MKILYLLPISAIILLSSACSKENNNPPFILPTGSFTGQFLRVRLDPVTSKLDTSTANLVLTLNQSTGFTVTGDTTSLHAGSYGSFAANAYYMQFVDQTYNLAKPGTKYHLNGVYNYEYNGAQLVIYANYADTLSLQYKFTKNN